MQKPFHFFRKERTADICFIRQILLERLGPEPSRLRGSLEDQFFGSILGSRAHDYISLRAFTRLAKRYDGDWNVVAQAPESEIYSLRRLQPGTRIGPNVQLQSLGHGFP